jgi:hypothetical protein
MIKLKTLLYLNEWFTKTQMAGMTPTSGDNNKLRPVPGSANDTPDWDNDVESWDGLKEGTNWFAYRGSNNWQEGNTKSVVCITEDNDKPRKFWIKIKTKGLRKPNDTHSSYNERVKKHGDKITKMWITTAKKLHNDPKKITEVGNKIMRNWSESFCEALKELEIKGLIEASGESQITGYDNSPDDDGILADPINFTPRI